MAIMLHTQLFSRNFDTSNTSISTTIILYTWLNANWATSKPTTSKPTTTNHFLSYMTITARSSRRYPFALQFGVLQFSFASLRLYPHTAF